MVEGGYLTVTSVQYLHILQLLYLLAIYIYILRSRINQEVLKLV